MTESGPTLKEDYETILTVKKSSYSSLDKPPDRQCQARKNMFQKFLVASLSGPRLGDIWLYLEWLPSQNVLHKARLPRPMELQAWFASLCLYFEAVAWTSLLKWQLAIQWNRFELLQRSPCSGVALPICTNMTHILFHYCKLPADRYKPNCPPEGWDQQLWDRQFKAQRELAELKRWWCVKIVLNTLMLGK